MFKFIQYILYYGSLEHAMKLKFMFNGSYMVYYQKILRYYYGKCLKNFHRYGTF